MSIKDRLSDISRKICEHGSSIETEEATKNAFVMPFLHSVLGYDVFNPHEVVPEFIADTGIKKGEKVDYAILKDGEVKIIIECKKFNCELKEGHASQLFRYFSVTNARIAILTNGSHYRLYTDLDAANKMDEKPFLEFNLMDDYESFIPEIQKLSKKQFDLDAIISVAGDLKYLTLLKRELEKQFSEPDADFVKLLTSRVYAGSFTQKVREQFTDLVSKAMKDFMKDEFNERIKSAFEGSQVSLPDQSGPSENNTQRKAKREVITTQDELEAFYLIKSILCNHIDIKRIHYRDTLNYFGINYDNNPRQTLFRLFLDGPEKSLVLIDENKNEKRIPISSIDDIYLYRERVLGTAKKIIDQL